MAKAGLVYSPDFLLHDTGSHPECPERLRAVLAALDKQGYLDSLVKLPPVKEGPALLELVHHPDYIKAVEAMAKRGGGMWDADTVISPDSYRVALLAAGETVNAVHHVMGGAVENALVLVRPPGHHAEPDRGMGFCLFNNIAVAARYGQLNLNLKRILIVDWDVHHGNGTQAVFLADPGVMFFSVHQAGIFPGTGPMQELGSGEGRGYNINAPLPRGSGNQAYYYLFKQVLEPIALRYKPELVLVSAGFDAHFADPLGGMQVTTRGFMQLTELVLSIAGATCGGRTVFILEGGYDLNALGATVTGMAGVMMGLKDQVLDPAGPPRTEFTPLALERIEHLKRVLSPHWEF